MKTLFYLLLHQTTIHIPEILSEPIPFVFTPYICSAAIHNINLPSCTDCIHFQKNYWNIHESRCKYFGMKNVVTGKIKYEYADLCRRDNQSCGLQGKHFQNYRSDDFPKNHDDKYNM